MSTPKNLIDFLVNQANGVKGLADLNLPSVPHQYIQPIQARLDSCKIIPHDSEEQSIPIIDFTNWDDPDVQDSIFSAATKLGFFQIVNHGIPINVLDDLKASVHRFFELPVEEKKSVKEKSPPEVVRLATSFSPHAESVLEWKDYLQLVYTSEEKIHAYWPAVCKNQALEYMKYAEAFIRKLLKVLLKKLNVKELDKEREHALMGAMILGFNYYPACPEPELVSGVGPHSDISSITVLLQDDIGGLYVRGKDGDSWINVPPVNGALVINIGDVLQIMSNGRDQALEYMKYAEAFIRKLLKVLLKKLNVKDLDKEKEHALMGAMILGFNYYPACPQPELVSGVGPHSDISSITVLLQDDIGGLYVRGKDGDSWINVPPVNGALVINIGDVLQIMSNGRYKSIEHRVVANRNKTRISMPIFVNPAPDAIIGTLTDVLENEEKPHYKLVVFSDYFNYFFSKAHDGKKTIEFAKI